MLNILKWGLNFFKKHYNCSLCCMIPLFWGAPLLLHWCSVGIAGYSTGVPSVFHVLLFRLPAFLVLKPETPEHRTTEHGIPRNNRIRNTSVTVKHPATVAEQLISPKHQQNTQEYQQNTNVSRAKHPWTTKPYESNNTYSVF